MKSMRNEEHSLAFLPREIFESILLKLPVKSLRNCKSVSKSWNRIISSPSFANRYFSSSSQTPCFYAHTYQGYEYQGLWHFKDQKFEIKASLVNSFDKFTSILFCCNGILLLRRGNDYVLWNPHTNTSFTFQRPPHYFASPPELSYYGLCYDCKIDDYKMVAIWDCKTYSVFSCNNRTWSDLKNLLDISDICGARASIDGAICWECEYRGTPKLLYFDSGDEEFKIMDPPSGCWDEKYAVLMSWKGSLCYGAYDRSSCVIRIWRLINDKWKKITRINWRCLGNFCLCPIDDDKIFIYYGRSGIVYSYNEKSLNRCPIRGARGLPQFFPCQLTFY